MIKNISLLILILIISNCSAQENYKDYYYPIGTKKEVKIYKYIDKNNSNNIEYWKVTTNPKTNTILTESFTIDFRLYNVFEEQLNENGAEIIKYSDFEIINDSLNVRIGSVIIEKDVYKWYDDKKYRYSVKYKSPKYGNEEFTKERRKISLENINVRETEYSTLKFLDKYKIKSVDTGEIYEFYQFTYYAKNIGMVKYQRHHPNATTIELELDEIITEQKFDKLIEKARW